MYCTACGKELHAEAVVCMSCGAGTGNKGNVLGESDGSLIGWSILGFFVPIVALILYLIWKEERPRTARAAAKGGLVYLVFMAAIITFYIGIFAFVMSMGILAM